MLKLRDFLNTFDGAGLLVAIYNPDDDDDKPTWTGEYSSIPWWIAEAELDFSDGGKAPDWKICAPIDFRYNFKAGKPGIVIKIK